MEKRNVIRQTRVTVLKYEDNFIIISRASESDRVYYRIMNDTLF